MTTVTSRRTLALSQTIPAPVPTNDQPLDIDRLVPASRRFGATSVLPRVAVDRGVAKLEPGGGPRYVPMKTLGRGGMGEVALVEDHDIGRKVAQKRLLPGAGTSDVMRFVDEVRVVGKLDHPGIVPIHDVGLDEHGEFFFVMKYVEGDTLESVVEKIRDQDAATLAEWDTARRVQVVVAVLRALDYAHAHGILHRDIKPANVMLGKYGEVMLMDWGVARPIGGSPDAPGEAPPSSNLDPSRRVASTSVGTLIGTPIFMSPEQASGATNLLDGRSDLYAVCLMLHELLSGTHLHDGIEDMNQLLVRVMTMEAPSASSMFGTPGISPEFAHFLHRGLQHDPSKRWQSAGEMAEELLAILDGRCRIQCPFTLTRRALGALSRLLSRRPLLTLSALLMLATLSVTAIVSLVYRALD